MDYGPFGFIEEYTPLFAKWTGSGQHFGFLNQPSAGFANYNVLVASVVPALCSNGKKDPDEVAKPFLQAGAKLFEQKVDEMFRSKLGFEKDQDVGDDIWGQLEALMRTSRVDWTIFFRQLTYVAQNLSDNNDDEMMFAMIEGSDKKRAGSSAFYEALSVEARQEWIAWMKQWREALVSSGAAETAYERMRTANPKFVLREWMLVVAYTDAADGQEAELGNLYDLIQRPYEEGSDKEVEKYYRRAPEELLTKGGTGFMS
jgi:uncharacterized protein YdiU (UPF0061 family)